MTVLVTVLAIVGAVSIWLTATYAADGRLPRNHMAGIRTRATLRSDEAWSVAHTTAKGWLWAGSAAFASAAVPALLGRWTVVVWLLGLGLVLVVVGGVLGQRRAKALAS